MLCSKCNRELIENTKFCGSCGTLVETETTNSTVNQSKETKYQSTTSTVVNAIVQIVENLSIAPMLLGAGVGMSFQGWLANLAHIALAALFVLDILGKLKIKGIMPIISGAAAVVLGIMSFRYGFINGLVQIIYFGSVLLLLLGLDEIKKQNCGE